jgi:hypothetical protein
MGIPEQMAKSMTTSSKEIILTGFLTKEGEIGFESPEIHALSSSSLLFCFSVVVESAVFKS